MDVRLEKAIESDAQSIFDSQVNAFLPLLEVYKDYSTNPANETIGRMITRINNPSGAFKIELIVFLLVLLVSFVKRILNFRSVQCLFYQNIRGKELLRKRLHK